MFQPPALIAIAIAAGCLIWTAVLWFIVTALLRRIAKMDRELGFDPGAVLRKSTHGSARINGVNASGCVYLVEYEAGWVVGMMKIFGGGLIYLPRDETRLGELESVGVSVFRTSKREVEYANHSIKLYGYLAEMIGSDRDQLG